jgi:hypothetical protein
MSQTRKEIILRKRVKTNKFKKGFFNDDIIVSKNSKPLKRIGRVSKFQCIYLNNVSYEKVNINFKKLVSWICKGWTPNLETFEYIKPIFFENETKEEKKKKKERTRQKFEKKEQFKKKLLNYLSSLNNNKIGD